MISIKQDSRNQKVFIQIKRMDEATRRGLRQGFFQYGKDLQKTASRQILAKPKGGRTYLVRRGKTTRRHVASAPGESPANLSGAYRKSIGFKIYGSTNMHFGAGSSKVPYAVFLEKGTSRMKPRPGLGNAVRTTQRNAMRYFRDSIRRELGK